MKKLQIVGATTMAAVLTAVSALPVQAVVVRQTQEFSSSTSVKVEGGSDVKAEAESNSWGKQSQRIVTDDAPEYGYRSGRPAGRSVGKTWARPANNGQVRLTWDMRGGTCHVRYTEVGAAGYNYETSASCDEGGITIGGLVSGKSYRFQVRKDDGAWSRATTVRAW